MNHAELIVRLDREIAILEAIPSVEGDCEFIADRKERRKKAELTAGAKLAKDYRLTCLCEHQQCAVHRRWIPASMQRSLAGGKGAVAVRLAKKRRRRAALVAELASVAALASMPTGMLKKLIESVPAKQPLGSPAEGPCLIVENGELRGILRRAVVAAYLGPRPPGYHVCHRCDMPKCVMPNHLFYGSAADNMQDRTLKGRTTRAKCRELDNVQMTRPHFSVIGIGIRTPAPAPAPAPCVLERNAAKRDLLIRAGATAILGPAPAGSVIEHKCGEPRCILPDHLCYKAQSETPL